MKLQYIQAQLNYPLKFYYNFWLIYYSLITNYLFLFHVISTYHSIFYLMKIILRFCQYLLFLLSFDHIIVHFFEYLNLFFLLVLYSSHLILVIAFLIFYQVWFQFHESLLKIHFLVALFLC